MRVYIITIESILKIYIYICMYNEKKTHLLETNQSRHNNICRNMLEDNFLGDFKTTHTKKIKFILI